MTQLFFAADAIVRLGKGAAKPARLVTAAFLLVAGPALAQAPVPQPPANAAPSTGAQGASQAPASPATPAVPAAAADTAGAVETLKLPRDLSPWGMFLAADWIVKAVMTGLALASVVTWTVWLAKTVELWSLKTRVRRDIAALGRARAITEAPAQLRTGTGPVPDLLRAALAELQVSADTASTEGVKERVASRLERIEAGYGRRATFGTGILATIGSTGPFVGLFGTVWGIMNSFIGISRSQTTNLAVVAPGIAEALLATALGLVAAIPAVVIYNTIARSITGYRALLADAAAEVMRLVSRDLDRAAHDDRRNPLSAAAE